MNSIDSNTTSSISEPTVALSEAELWFQLIFAYGIIGILSIILHCLIAVTVFRIEKLNSRFYVFIFFLSITRVFYALGHVILFVHRSLRTASIIETATTSMACQMVHVFVLGPQTLDLLLLLILIVDRIFSFWRPLSYRNLSCRQASKICLGACAFCFLCRFVPSFVGVSTTKIIRCINIYSTVTPTYAAYTKNLDLALTILILLTYLVLVWAVRYRLQGGKKDKGQQSSSVGESAIKKSMKILPFLKLQLLMHCTLVLTARSMQVAAGFIGDEKPLAQRLQAYYGELCSVDVLVNAIVFYWRYPNLWYASLKMVVGEKLAKRLFRRSATEAETKLEHATLSAKVTPTYIVKETYVVKEG